jgi:hypothetical protein
MEKDGKNTDSCIGDDERLLTEVIDGSENDRKVPYIYRSFTDEERFLTEVIDWASWRGDLKIIAEEAGTPIADRDYEDREIPV